MSTEHPMEADVLKELKPHYEGRGLTFIVEPSADLLPSFLREFHPDAIAVAPDGSGGVVVEIKVWKDTRQTAPSLEGLANEVARHKGWSLDIVLADGTLRERWLLVPSTAELSAELMSLKADLAKLKLAEDSIGDLRVQLLFGWSLFEAAARRALLEDDVELKSSTNPKTLIEKLVIEGLLTDRDGAIAVDLMRIRGLIAHGFLKQQVSVDQVEVLLQLIEKLLRLEAVGFHES